MRDIAITGLGAISAAGVDIASTLATFKRGGRNPQKPWAFSTALPYLAFEVKDFSSPFTNEMRTVQLMRYAVAEALEDAGLRGNLKDFRVGVCLGTTVACQLNDIDFYRAYRQNGTIDERKIARYLKGNPAENLAAYLKLNGPVLTVTNACSSGTDAIGIAREWLSHDMCDIVICGGADELSHVAYCGFGSLSVSSDEPCRPFDCNRKGLNLGEGAGILILEKKEIAQKRGQKALLSLLGYASSADAHHLTAPHPEGKGLKIAINKVLKNCGLSPEEISFINAHGTATRDNDRTEGKVFKEIFGPKTKFISTKGFTGHALGAAGGLEAVFTCLGLREGWLPKSPGFEKEDPEIGLSPLTAPTQLNGCYAMSTSLAFGGNNSALVIGMER
jgi:3-oxoacyl-(acyl-carrier-protein) synthase